MAVPVYHASIRHLDMPDRIKALPVCPDRKMPVPFFVAWVDGKPVFPAVDPAKLARAVRERRCWVCGEPLARNAAFVIGPMCVVNRTSAEPPSHLECADFSARACPFLSTPGMGRVDLSRRGVETSEAAGVMIRRNPGACCVWATRSFGPFAAPGGGVLFRVGDPTAVSWFAQGRPATRGEVLASAESGLPLLREMAERDGPAGVAHLEKLTAAAAAYWPAAEPTPAEVPG